MKGILTWIVFLVVLISCKKEVSDCAVEEVFYPHQFKISLVANGSTYALNTIYNGTDGTPIRVEQLKLYISELELFSQGSWQRARAIELLNYENNLSQVSFDFSSTVNNYDSIKFNIGVPSELNGSENPSFDPTVYGVNHPLNVTNSGMYWAWNTGYKFILFDAKADLNADGTLEQGISIHLGTSPYLINYKTASNSIMDFELKLDSIFQSNQHVIDLNTENQFHGTSNFELALKFKENFENCLTLKTN